MTFKNQLVQAVRQLNSDIDTCQMLTPQVCFLQIARMKIRLEQTVSLARTRWCILKQVKPERLDAFFKDLIENVDNNPEVHFKSAFKPPTISKLIEVWPTEDQIPPELRPLKNDSEMEEKTTFDDDSESSMMSETGLIEVVDELSADEKELRQFLDRHPELEGARQANLSKLRAELSNRRRHSVYTLVNKDGVAARCFVLDEGDLILFRKDPTGEELLSRGVNSKWYKLNLQDKKCAGFSLSLVKQVKDKAVKLNLNSLASNLNTFKFDPVVGVGMSSMTGSLGTLLFDIVEGKKKFTSISTDFIKGSAQDFVVTLFVNSLPFVALTLGTALGAYSLATISMNKKYTKRQKAQMISTVFMKGGVRSAISVGGAIAGNILVPIPIVGSVVGSIIGGFAAEVAFKGFDKLIEHCVLIEPLAFYCLCMLDNHGYWDKAQMPGFSNKVFERFCKLISYISPTEPATMEILVVKQKTNFHGLVESLYIKVADDPDGEENRPQIHVRKWKTLIAFGIICYFHFLLSVKFTELAEIDDALSEVYLTSVSKLAEMVELDRICENLARWFWPAGPKQLNKVIKGIADLVKHENIRCIFVGKSEDAEIKENELKEKSNSAKKTNSNSNSSKKSTDHSLMSRHE